MAYQNVCNEEQNSNLILDFICISPTSYYGSFSNMAATGFDQKGKGSFYQISYISELLVDFDNFSLYFLFLEGNVTKSEVHGLYQGQEHQLKVKVKVKVNVILI